MTEDLQNTLSKCLPHSSEHVASKLALCVGIPVMIKNDDETELCITKGQEGVVAGWDTTTGPYGQVALETLFLQLVDPLKNIQLPNLPLNVIPMSRTTTTIMCKLPSDMLMRIQQQQVLALPNFSMTDYASQGETWKHNVVDLGNCISYMSYYTCLSMSVLSHFANKNFILSEAKVCVTKPQK
jgi:hypothetical protein